MKYLGLDLLKGIAAFFIVGCHLRMAETSAAEALLHFCNMFVGVFGAISGFLLAGAMQKYRKLSEVMVRRLHRFVPLSFSWSLLYVIVSWGFGFMQEDSTKIERLSNLDYWLSVVFYGGSSCHLWYLSALIYSTFVIVCLEGVLRAMGKNRNIVFVGWLWLVVGGIVIYATTCFGRAHWAIYELRLLGLMLTGVGIYRWGREAKSDLMPLTLCVGGAIVMHITLAGILPAFVRDWLVVVPLVLLFSRLNFPQLEKLSCILSRYSLGVYLWHPIFAAILYVILNWLLPHPYGPIVVLADWVTCYCLALVVTSASKRTWLKRFE